jgi:hypothetical protein
MVLSWLVKMHNCSSAKRSYLSSMYSAIMGKHLPPVNLVSMSIISNWVRISINNLISIKICPCEGEKGFFYPLNGDENLAAGLFAVTSEIYK